MIHFAVSGENLFKPTSLNFKFVLSEFGEWNENFKATNFDVSVMKKRQCTNEADGSAYEGVEVAAGSVDVGLSSGAALLLGQTAEQDGLSNHDLITQKDTVKDGYAAIRITTM